MIVSGQAWPYDTDTNLTALVDVDFEAALRNASRTGPYIMCESYIGSPRLESMSVSSHLTCLPP